jgi:hypothetical protein
MTPGCPGTAICHGIELVQHVVLPRGNNETRGDKKSATPDMVNGGASADWRRRRPLFTVDEVADFAFG